MSAEVPAKRRGRKGNPAARRQAILEAAIEQFLAQGFAATTLESVARQAGVAKGTIYLYFADKEALFRALVQDIAGPVIGEAEATVPAFTGPFPVLARQLVLGLVRQVLQTHRKRLLQLVITEAPRFPWLAEIYWQEVVSRALATIRAVARQAVARGELASPVLERFPQLLPAPLLIGFLWTTLFQRFEPLDLEAFVETYVDLLLRGLEAKP
ncbi:MAG TPA: TetR/AcrR family transcriptional regulator [Kiloniellales bacterium]|nr:TetR/AcrR family transcriptional regulator [Kiloniellales bacterium]